MIAKIGTSQAVAAMTDARMPERWVSDRRLQRLSDAHYRSYFQALLWSVSNRTDGVIEPEDLGLIPNFAVGAPQAFVTARLWTPLRHGWLIADFDATQTVRSELEMLENVRARERRKKQRQRAAKADETADVPGTVPGDGPEGQSRGTTQEGRQARQAGKDREGAPPAPVDLDSDHHNHEPVMCQRCSGWIAAGDTAGNGDNPNWCRGCNDTARADMAGGAL